MTNPSLLDRSRLNQRAASGHDPKPGFSGWWILLVTCLAVFLSGPAQTYGVSVFVDPMIDELGWSRSLFSSLYSVGTLVSAGALVLVGRQIDRVGNRIIISVAALLFGGALFLLSAVNSVIMLVIGFGLLRTFGSGVLTLAARTLVPNWFHSRAGRAFSLIGLAAMLSQALIPSFNNAMIESVGWRDAFRVNAFIMWLLCGCCSCPLWRSCSETDRAISASSRMEYRLRPQALNAPLMSAESHCGPHCVQSRSGV